MNFFCVIFLFGFALFASIADATSHEFFKGKSIRLVVGTSAGGAQDEWARFLAPHLGRNIPGGPDIVVQNMPGAGTVIAANYIHNIAKPDGLTLGLVNPAIYIDQLLGAKEKLTADDATPLMPEAHEKVIKEIPRDPEVAEIFKKIVGAGPLPPH